MNISNSRSSPTHGRNTVSSVQPSKTGDRKPIAGDAYHHGSMRDPSSSSALSSLRAGPSTEIEPETGGEANTETKLDRRAPPSVGELARQKAALMPVKFALTPWAPNLAIVRDGNHVKHAPHEFTDFVEQTRHHLTTLAMTNSGGVLFEAIRRSAPKDKAVRIEDAGDAPGIRQANRKNRATACNGTGSSATVSHHADAGQRWGMVEPTLGVSPKWLEDVGSSSVIGLGHELCHAAGAVNGIQEPKYKKEELRTIGDKKGNYDMRGMSTENSIRKDLKEQVYAGSGVVGDIKPRLRHGGRLIESPVKRWAESAAKFIRKYTKPE